MILFTTILKPVDVFFKSTFTCYMWSLWQTTENPHKTLSLFSRNIQHSQKFKIKTQEALI